ncbi:hypothetical protein C8F04DRAFT_1180783 [Mycena alexandri]|uniref:Uncharacterized protein n=1 Tax=Mycena alexandri TaxID=1745969 RepID=A0AAD6T258_9AGAR|nr:hypothetical protein C8F04DRAFT_1180783 [Mycena alexandri]
MVYIRGPVTFPALNTGQIQGSNSGSGVEPSSRLSRGGCDGHAIVLMVDWSDLGHCTNPNCSFKGSCRKFCSLTPLGEVNEQLLLLALCVCACRGTGEAACARKDQLNIKTKICDPANKIFHPDRNTDTRNSNDLSDKVWQEIVPKSRSFEHSLQ